MCQKSFHEAPLQMFVQSMCQLIKQVRENAGHCKDFLSDHDIQLQAAFINTEQIAEQLQSQLEQIIRDLDINKEKGRPQQTMITYFD